MKLQNLLLLERQVTYRLLGSHSRIEAIAIAWSDMYNGIESQNAREGEEKIRHTLRIQTALALLSRCDSTNRTER